MPKEWSSICRSYVYWLINNAKWFTSCCSWYHDNLKRDKAEDMLKRVRRNGAFLVRKKESDNPAAEQEQAENNPESQNDESSFAISFRWALRFVCFIPSTINGTVELEAFHCIQWLLYSHSDQLSISKISLQWTIWLAT